jgi:nitronate monooxygenase
VQLNEKGEPIYGERDVPDLAAIHALGLPFWLGGSYGEPERVVAALQAGATGVQVGTAFAYCEESDLDPKLKRQVLEASRQGRIAAFTDPIVSPAGFPFKVVQLEGSLWESDVYAQRTRICDLGYLRHGYKKPDGTIGWRCPAEPVDDYVTKGGDTADTIGRKCLCNALMANIGLAQHQRDGEIEKPLVTSGDDVANVARFLKPGAQTYNAIDVIEYLLRDVNRSQQESPHL